MIYTRLLAFLLSFALIFSSTSALANTSIGGWTALDTLTAGATNTINAVKGSGATAMRSAVAVAPSVAKVGGHLIRGGAVGVLAMAVSQTLGDGIDWVLDPANNSIRYVDPDAVDPNPLPVAGVKIWYLYNTEGKYRAGSANALCQMILGDNWNGNNVPLNSSKNGANCYDWVGNPHGIDYGVPPDAVTSPPPYVAYKNLPISDVAAQVVANAEAGDVPSQEAVKAVALEGFAAGEHDVALEAAAVPDTSVDTGTGTGTGTDTGTGSDTAASEATAQEAVAEQKKTVGLLDAIKALIEGLVSKVSSLSDWFQSDPTPEDTNLDIPEPPLPSIDSSISFGGSCPDDLGADFNLYGTNFNFVLMPFSKLCPLLSTFIKPTLILLGSFMAVAIVGGRKDA